ncbi:hypothetical protein, partial [Xanthomonas axonopodis]|uniref:hypothetical protein n=3 Tax=Xanthomonas TaxID=338 RepID=UPI001C37DF42
MNLQPACVRELARVRSACRTRVDRSRCHANVKKVLALLRGLDKLRGLAQHGGASRSIATTNEANRKHHKVLTKR